MPSSCTTSLNHSAMRLLPQPAGPTNITNRCGAPTPSITSSHTSRNVLRTSSRPTKGLGRILSSPGARSGAGERSGFGPRAPVRRVGAAVLAVEERRSTGNRYSSALGRHLPHSARASAANSQRSQGRLAKSRVMNAIVPSGASITAFSAGGCSNACTRSSSFDSPEKGARPANSRYRMQPSEYRSVAPHTWCISCWICSGAM